MNCPGCGEDTPAGKRFCTHCGKLLGGDFAEVKRVMEAESEEADRAALERSLGRWLAVSVALLAFALAFRLGHRAEDLPRFDEAAVLDVREACPLAPLPSPALPVLLLEVPK